MVARRLEQPQRPDAVDLLVENRLGQTRPDTGPRGKAVPLYGTGQTRRDYTYIDDIVDGVLAALDLAPGFEIFNLGGSQTTTLIDLVHWIAEALEVPARVEMLPDQPGDVPITFADVSKAARMLGYSPKVPIREGLRRVAAWYRSRPAAGAP